MAGERHIQVVPDCTCDASGVVIRHSPDCAVAQAGLDIAPAPTPEQAETLAQAVLAFHDRWMAPPGKRQRITAEKREVIRQAVEVAEEMLGTEHRHGRW